jgi:hypothetical protein
MNSSRLGGIELTPSFISPSGSGVSLTLAAALEQMHQACRIGLRSEGGAHLERYQYAEGEHQLGERRSLVYGKNRNRVSLSIARYRGPNSCFGGEL